MAFWEDVLEKVDVKTIAEKHNVDTEIAKRVIDYIEQIARLWYDKPFRFELLDNAIEKIMQNDQEFAKYYNLFWTLHLSSQFGWIVRQNAVLLICEGRGSYDLIIVAKKKEVRKTA
ncbi:MAG: hypothetical protein QW540_08140 [Archaeoglobaceae archaeon]